MKNKDGHYEGFSEVLDVIFVYRVSLMNFYVYDFSKHNKTPQFIPARVRLHLDCIAEDHGGRIPNE